MINLNNKFKCQFKLTINLYISLRFNNQQLVSLEEKHNTRDTARTQQYEQDLLASKNEIQQQFLVLQETTKQILICENEQKIENLEKEFDLRKNEVEKNHNNKIILLNEENRVLLEELKAQKDIEFDIMKKEAEIKLHLTNTQFDETIESLHNNYNQEKDKLILENKEKISDIQTKLTSLEIQRNLELSSQEKAHEKNIELMEEKLFLIQEKFTIFQAEHNKQLELASNFEIQKLNEENLELKGIQGELNLELIYVRNEISGFRYIITELCRLFVSCCDAMCVWDDALGFLLEGPRSTDRRDSSSSSNSSSSNGSSNGHIYSVSNGNSSSNNGIGIGAGIGSSSSGNNYNYSYGNATNNGHVKNQQPPYTTVSKVI